MSYIYAIISIISWGLAPIIFKYFLANINIIISFIFILFFAGLHGIFSKNILKFFKEKIFILNIVIISFLTIIHYLGNFYGIIFGNIILTTLLIKNSPFFQNLIYSILYKQKFKKYNYIIGVLLIIGVSLLSYNDTGLDINILHIIIPLFSSIAWSFLIIFLSKIKNQKEVFSLGNLFSSIIVFTIYIIFGNINFDLIQNINVLHYFILFILGIIPTFIAPILWSKSINNLGNKIIFFDYLTPIITIIFSIFLFDLILNSYNYIGIFLILITLFIYSYLNNKIGKH